MRRRAASSMTAHRRSGPSSGLLLSVSESRFWRCIRTWTRLSTSAGAVSGQAPRTRDWAYSVVWSRPGITRGSYVRRLAASVSRPMYTLYGMSPKACHQPCWRESFAICMSESMKPAVLDLVHVAQVADVALADGTAAVLQPADLRLGDEQALGDLFGRHALVLAELAQLHAQSAASDGGIDIGRHGNGTSAFFCRAAVSLRV